MRASGLLDCGVMGLVVSPATRAPERIHAALSLKRKDKMSATSGHDSARRAWRPRAAATCSPLRSQVDGEGGKPTLRDSLAHDRTVR
jgi:hypothetical protein